MKEKVKITAFRILTLLHVVRLCTGICSDYLVSGPNGVPDQDISASSGSPACGRLYTMSSYNAYSQGCLVPSDGGWCSDHTDPTPYIQVKFARLHRIMRVSVQQQHLVIKEMLETFKVTYSENGHDWSLASSNGTKIFGAPTNPIVDEEKVVTFDPHIVTRYVRIEPVIPKGPTTVCLRFDVIGCKYAMEAKTQYEYTQLPEVAINSSGIISDSSAEDLRKCATRCRRDVTCQSFSYGHANKRCVGYRFNKCVPRINDNSMAILANNDTLYFCDPDMDTPMTDHVTGVTYKVVMQKSNQDDAVLSCAALGMRLFVIDTDAKRDLLIRIVFPSLILRGQKVRVGGGFSFVNGLWGWWDGNGKLLQEKLVSFSDPAGKPCVILTVVLRYLHTSECSTPMYFVCES
ncbi:uncharacterized protein LOC110460220 [Mizuhopecten yessoensis]|uniref:Tyrosine-protein phosphatase non-receptor type 9 n=1 Tax=Mizuhopecten yessoensis TaxID=6573 RepID=A0A210Q2X6_MIZYE|nr:uncharacterized protein LOC110460220 [Mizuhopecten yessoensis]OWF43101.1 Tyrosine-protein phosphatase non-receptor type 9 [Mizuhopecten yessoensis]